MTTKENLIKLLDDRFDLILSDGDYTKVEEVANEIIELSSKSYVKEKLYKGALKRELKDKYEEDKYGIHCIPCGAYNPIAKELFHYPGCPTAQLERILSI